MCIYISYFSAGWTILKLSKIIFTVNDFNWFCENYSDYIIITIFVFFKYTCKLVALSRLATSNDVGGHWHFHSKQLVEAVVASVITGMLIQVVECGVGAGDVFQALGVQGVLCGMVGVFQIVLVGSLNGWDWKAGLDYWL